MKELFELWDAMEITTEIQGRRCENVHWYIPDYYLGLKGYRMEVVRYFDETIGRIDWTGQEETHLPCHSIVFELNKQDVAWIAQHEFTRLNEVENTKAWLNYFIEQLASVPRNYELYNGKRNRPTFGTFNEFVKGKVQ